MAALAAGVATSMAQNVYSLNIVGYANVQNPLGFSFQSAPFTAGVTNGANEILPPNVFDAGLGYGPYDGNQLLIWNRAGFHWDVYVLDSTKPSGFSVGGNAAPAPIITAGLGYLYNNQDVVVTTNTYVGQVRTGTNIVTFSGTGNTFFAAGSPVPYAGGISTSLNMTNIFDAGLGYGPFDDSQIQTPQISGGNITGFNISIFDSTKASGFKFPNQTQAPEPQIAVGQGFFFNNQAAANLTWTQVFNP